MADTLVAKRVGGARTRRIPKKRQKEKANNFVRPETASVLNDFDCGSKGAFSTQAREVVRPEATYSYCCIEFS